MADDFNLSEYRAEISGIRSDLNLIFTAVNKIKENRSINPNELYSLSHWLLAYDSSAPLMMNPKELYKLVRLSSDDIINLIKGTTEDKGLLDLLIEQEQKLSSIFGTERPLDPRESYRLRYEIINDFNSKILDKWRSLRALLGKVNDSAVREVDILEQGLDKIANLVSEQMSTIENLIKSHEEDLDILIVIRKIRDLILPFKEFQRSAFSSHLTNLKFGNDIKTILNNYFRKNYERISFNFAEIDKIFSKVENNFEKLELTEWDELSKYYYDLGFRLFADTMFYDYFKKKREIITEDELVKLFYLYLDKLVLKIEKIYNLDGDHVNANVGSIVLEGSDKTTILGRNLEEDIKVSNVIERIKGDSKNPNLKSDLYRYVGILHAVVDKGGEDTLDEKFIFIQPSIGGNPIADREPLKTQRLEAELKKSKTDFVKIRELLININRYWKTGEFSENDSLRKKIISTFSAIFNGGPRSGFTDFLNILLHLGVLFDREKNRSNDKVQNILRTFRGMLEGDFQENLNNTQKEFIKLNIQLLEKYFIGGKTGNRDKIINKLEAIRRFYYPSLTITDIWIKINDNFKYLK
ncbi:MAG: hypothetical protein ACOCUD_05135 [Bacillota bacterium]